MQDMEVNPLHFFSFCINSLSSEKNVYIINELLKMSIYTIKNYISNNFQQPRFDQIINFVTTYQDESIKKNLINYILDIIDISNHTKQNQLFAFLLEMYNSSDQMDYVIFYNIENIL